MSDAYPACMTESPADLWLMGARAFLTHTSAPRRTIAPADLAAFIDPADDDAPDGDAESGI